jgi:CheY-like chemotaxis protein
MSGFGTAPTTPYLILCVDDNATPLLVRKLLLENVGYAVLTATSGEQAIELLRHNPVTLVVTDHVMSGMTGVEAAREMKRLKPEVPIILVSGHSEQPEGAEYADAYFVKGTGTESFLALVSRLTTTRDG